MSVNINLLIRTDKDSLKRRKITKILDLIAILSLLGVGLIALIIFMSIRAVNSSSISKEQENVLAKLSQFQARQVKLFVLNDRIENIDKILTIRKNISGTLSGLLAAIPGRLSVDDFEVDDKSVIIAGQSQSLSVIGEFINNLADMVRRKEIIKSLTLNSLILNESNHTYQVSIKSEL